MLSRAAAEKEQGVWEGRQPAQNEVRVCTLSCCCQGYACTVCVCVCYCVLYVFSLFYFCWRQRKQLRLFAGASPSLSLSVWACPAADESTFAFTQVTKHKRNETERKSQTKRAQVKQKPQWRHGKRERDGERGQRAQPAKIRHNSTHRWAA